LLAVSARASGVHGGGNALVLVGTSGGGGACEGLATLSGAVGDGADVGNLATGVGSA